MYTVYINGAFLGIVLLGSQGQSQGHFKHFTNELDIDFDLENPTGRYLKMCH